ncbi:hypothetical protein [Domibacillus aminovorans]|uniref:hypothetical protein n=1 Tax=Domibacillus aminovorans TaxID=29332 RepID=UPI0012FE2CC7|nr:hypothetical protein [Domibacillus aminovorans]
MAEREQRDQAEAKLKEAQDKPPNKIERKLDAITRHPTSATEPKTQYWRGFKARLPFA